MASLMETKKVEVSLRNAQNPKVNENNAGISVTLKDFSKDDGEIRIVLRFADKKIFLEANQRTRGEKRSRNNWILFDLSKEELEVMAAGIEKILKTEKVLTKEPDYIHEEAVYDAIEKKRFLDAARAKDCYGKCEDLEFCADDKECPVAYECAAKAGLRSQGKPMLVEFLEDRAAFKVSAPLVKDVPEIGVNLVSSWCDCPNMSEIMETKGTVFRDNGTCSCGIHKHHYHCPVCGRVTQIG